MYGGEAPQEGEKKPVSGAKKATGFGTSAYMLVYRRVQPENQVIEVPDSLIPPEITEEVILENEEFNVQKEKYIKRKESLLLKVNHNEQARTVIIHKRETLSKLM